MIKTTQTKRTIISLTGAYVATLAILGLSNTAWGGAPYTRDLHSAICHYKYDNVGSTLDNSGALTNNGTTNRNIICPILSDPGLTVNTSTIVDVLGVSGDPGSRSRACANFPLSQAFLCDSHGDVTWGTGPGYVATILTNSWSAYAYFPYVYHVLTPGSSLYGMQVD